MYQPNLFWGVAHPLNEVDQIILVCMGAITANRMDFCMDRVALVIEFYPPISTAIFLDGSTGCTFCLIAHKKNIVRLSSMRDLR